MADHHVNLDIMTIEEIEAHIAEMTAAVNTAGCSRCAANRYNSKIRKARRRLTTLRFEQIAAEAQARQAEQEPSWEHPS